MDSIRFFLFGSLRLELHQTFPEYSHDVCSVIRFSSICWIYFVNLRNDSQLIIIGKFHALIIRCFF